MSQETRNVETPTPGSQEAIDMGCTCPIIDNAYGRGAQGTSGDDAIFWHSGDCPVHVLDNKQSNEDEE